MGGFEGKLGQTGFAYPNTAVGAQKTDEQQQQQEHNFNDRRSRLLIGVALCPLHMLAFLAVRLLDGDDSRLEPQKLPLCHGPAVVGLDDHRRLLHALNVFTHEVAPDGGLQLLCGLVTPVQPRADMFLHGAHAALELVVGQPLL